MSVGGLRVRVLPGKGLVAKKGGGVLVALPGGSPGRLDGFLSILEEVCLREEAPGRPLARRLSVQLAGIDPEEVPPFGVVAPAREGWVLILHGAVSARVVTDGADQHLSGLHAATWLDRILQRPVSLLVLGGDTDVESADDRMHLEDGVVPGGGVLLESVSSAAEADAAPLVPASGWEPRSGPAQTRATGQRRRRASPAAASAALPPSARPVDPHAPTAWGPNHAPPGTGSHAAAGAEQAAHLPEPEVWWPDPRRNEPSRLRPGPGSAPQPGHYDDPRPDNDSESREPGQGSHAATHNDPRPERDTTADDAAEPRQGWWDTLTERIRDEQPDASRATFWPPSDDREAGERAEPSADAGVTPHPTARLQPVGGGHDPKPEPESPGGWEDQPEADGPLAQRAAVHADAEHQPPGERGVEPVAPEGKELETAAPDERAAGLAAGSPPVPDAQPTGAHRSHGTQPGAEQADAVGEEAPRHHGQQPSEPGDHPARPTHLDPGGERALQGPASPNTVVRSPELPGEELVLRPPPLPRRGQQPTGAWSAEGRDTSEEGEDEPPFEAIPLVGSDPTVSPEARDPLPVPARDHHDAAPPTTGQVLVEGLLCERGHFNHPKAEHCAQCGMHTSAGAGSKTTGPRPSLGVLLLDDGTTYTLDAEYVVGREPERDSAIQNGRGRPLRLADPHRSVSRVHATVELEDWTVFVVDRGSSNGTYVAPRGAREWTRLQEHLPHPLTPGTRVAVGQRILTFNTHHQLSA